MVLPLLTGLAMAGTGLAIMSRDDGIIGKALKKKAKKKSKKKTKKKGKK